MTATCVLGLPLFLAAALGQPRGPALPVTEVVRRVAATENQFLAELARHRPVVESYLQFVREEPDSAGEIVGDAYFIGTFEFRRGIEYRSLSRDKTFEIRKLRLLPRGFAQMAVIDNRNFSPEHYDFENAHGEFLGEVRCIVFDVRPKPNERSGRFIGRIWVEDQGFHVVRFAGTYTEKGSNRYFHFNSYRQEVGPGLWMPAITYVEESNSEEGVRPQVDLKGHVRFWSFGAGDPLRRHTFTNILVEASEPLQDHSDGELSRTEALRAWQRQAEDNTLQRMQKAGLLGPEGEVEKVLETVLNNLLVTNGVVLDPPVRTRLLLSTPFESFTIGRTIVLSRGLVDVLPSEASLAAVIARELAGILVAFKAPTWNAFSDRLIFDDQAIFHEFRFRRSAAEESQANRKALELLKSSPYAGQLPGVGLFLTALAAKVKGLPNLTQARIGNPIAERGAITLLPELMSSAPKLEPASTTQIPALPLGSRIRLDPWTNRAELVRAKPVALVSAKEKMAFEVTPVVLALKRQDAKATVDADRE